MRQITTKERELAVRLGAKLGINHVVEYSGSMYAVDMTMSEKYKLDKAPAVRVGG
ncbi:MAG: hypothetical protein RPU64_16010 [Candidatus Sedimenticola sp. (ex Thyasira tokunagai)]